MKIGFPLSNTGQLNDIRFDSNLHSCTFFGVFCNKTKQLNIVQTNSVLNAEGGSNIVNYLKSEEIDRIISPECYSMAAKILADNGIDVYQASSDKVLENIEKMEVGELSPFSKENAKVKNTCSESCSSCDSTCNEVEQELISI